MLTPSPIHESSNHWGVLDRVYRQLFYSVSIDEAAVALLLRLRWAFCGLNLGISVSFLLSSFHDVHMLSVCLIVFHFPQGSSSTSLLL